MFRFGEDVPGGRHMTAEIGGRDRFKFFKRPVVPAIEGATQTTPPAAIPLATRPVVHMRSQHLQAAELGGRSGGGTLPLGPHATRPRTLGELPAGARSLKPRRRSTSRHGASSASGAASARESGECEDGSGGGGSQVREMACQTLFRESDCQTDPFTPDYFVAEGEQPEVLALMELRHGEGLPAGLGEIDMIDRVQRRKFVEANLPQGSDNAAMERRLNALESLERAEGDEREAHIAQLQEARLKQIEAALVRREERREEASKARVEEVKRAKLREVEQRLTVLQDRRLAATRKLTQRHVNPCCEKEERDLIKSHVLHGPRARAVRSNTLVEKIDSNNYDVRPTLLSFPEGMQELEKTSVPKMETVREAQLRAPEEPAVRALETNFQKRRARRVVSDLEYASHVIDSCHEVKEKAASIQDLYRATPRLQRPDTPTLALEGDDDEEKEEAMLLLQRLLRGRAVQNDFFEGKERCHGLIEELQSASNARDAEKKRPKWLLDQLEEAEEARRAGLVQAVIDGVQGDVVFATVDFAFKELLRQQQAATVDRLRDEAEATRRAREQAERARREAEGVARAKEEAQYAQLVRSLSGAVSTFLAQSARAAVADAAANQAMAEQLQRRAARREAPEPASALDEEDLVCELLDTFIVPQVCARQPREEAARVERAVVHTALSAVDEISSSVAWASRK